MNLGTHAIFDLVWRQEPCTPLLTNSFTFTETMFETCDEAGATVISFSEHKFGEGGFTYMFMLAESHASVHTYPEHGVAMFDIFTCGDVDAFKMMNSFLKKLEERQAKPDHTYQTNMYRGFVGSYKVIPMEEEFNGRPNT